MILWGQWAQDMPVPWPMHRGDPFISNQQVSSKAQTLSQNVDMQLKMEEFGDLSALLPVESPTVNLTDSIDELNTPVFDKDPFNFNYVKQNQDKSNLKVKVEYNAHVYQWPGVQALSSNSNSRVSVGTEQQEMFLYQQPLNAHELSYKTTSRDDVANLFNSDLYEFDNKVGNQQTSLGNLAINSNVKYSSSNVPSPQDSHYSYNSSPTSDLTISPFEKHPDIKPKLNLMIDQFKFPVKEEGPSTLNTPDVIDDVVNMGNDFNILDLVNNDDITILNADDEFIAKLTTPTELSTPPSTPSTTESKPASPAKRPRKRKILYDDDDDDDEDYIPTSKRESTVSLKDIDFNNYSSDDSDYEINKYSKKVKTNKPRGRPPKRTYSVSSDGSKDAEVSKYRELRDKNNEASRKSRLKRKIKEMEYEKEAEELHMKNIKLKAQVEELEKMVTTFRNNLFKLLVNK